MPNIIAESFSKYTGTITNFENFNTQNYQAIKKLG